MLAESGDADAAFRVAQYYSFSAEKLDAELRSAEAYKWLMSACALGKKEACDWLRVKGQGSVQEKEQGRTKDVIP